MNAFLLFGLDPSPSLEAGLVKNRFLEMSGVLHPDVAGGESSAAFAQLNQAYKILSSDRLRLKHLLELGGVNDPGSISAVPRHLGDLFMKAGAAMESANRLIKARSQAEGVLEQASLQAESLEKVEELQELLADFFSRRNDLRSRLERLNNVWENSPGDLSSLKDIYLEFSYLDKWIEQGQEKAFVLSSA